MALRDHYHGHECPKCETVWEHHPDDFASKAEFDKGHECPKCGCSEYECWTPIPAPSRVREDIRRVYGL